MVQPTLNTFAPTTENLKSMQLITKCGEDLYKDSQPSAAERKTPITTPQGTSMLSDSSYQHLKLNINGKVKNYLVALKKPSSDESGPVIAYGPFDFLEGKMTSTAVNISQTGSTATSVKYSDSQPASTNKPLFLPYRASPTCPVKLSLAKPVLTQNTTASQLSYKPAILANKPAVVTSKHSVEISASAALAKLVSIAPITSNGTRSAPSQLPAASKILAAYSQNSSLRSSDKLASSLRTLHSSTASLVSRPAYTLVPNPCNLEAATSGSSSVLNAPIKATVNRQTSGLEMGGTSVKGQSSFTFIMKNPTSSMAKANGCTSTRTTCSNAQNTFVVVKEDAGKIIALQNGEKVKHTAVGVPSQGAGAVAANSSAVRPFPCLPTVVSSYSSTIPKITTVNMVNVPFQQKLSEVSNSEHSLKIDSVYSLANPTPATVECVKTSGSAGTKTPGPSLSECADYTAESSILPPEQPTFLEVIDVVPCKVVLRKISQHFPRNITKKTVNQLCTYNIRKRPWSKLVREHLSSYYRGEKFAKIDLNPENVYKILQESPLTVVAMPRKAVQTDKIDDDTVEVYQKPQTARKRGYMKINRSDEIIDNVLKKRPRKSSENNEDLVPLSRPRPLLMSALLSSSSLPVSSVTNSTAPHETPMCSVAKSTVIAQTPQCLLAKSTATPQTPVLSVAQSTATPEMPMCSVVISTAISSPPKYKSIIDPAVVSPKKGIVYPTIMSPNKGIANPSINAQDECVDSLNALKPVLHQNPAEVLQKDKERLSVVNSIPGLTEMSCGETKKVSFPLGPCVTAGLTGKAVLPGKEGSEPENYLILRTSQSCYFVPVGKNAYVVPISKATEVVQSCKKPVPSNACFGDVTSVSERRAIKVASQVTTMPVLTAEAGASNMSMKTTPHQDISKTVSGQTDNTQLKTSFQGGDISSKSETNNVFSGVRIKSEPVTTGYPGDPDNEDSKLSPVPSPIPGVLIKTENDSETDDAWSGTEMPDDEAPAEEEAPFVPFKSVADLYRSRQGQYHHTVNNQATEEDEEAAGRAERIRKLRELMKSKEKRCDKARQSLSGDQTEKLIKEFDDI
ncbi:uncharacterized protein LOC135488471 isoform X2 [Lineus longissimus]